MPLGRRVLRALAELALPATMFGGYDAVCRLRPGTETAGLANGRSLLTGWDRPLATAGRTVNHWLASHHALQPALSGLYNDAHYGLTAAVLVALLILRPREFRVARTALWGILLVGAVVFFWHPTAPPRLLAGYVDVVARTTGVRSTLSDPAVYQAMPSMHVAWACVSAYGLTTFTRRRLLRALAVTYPVVIGVVVVATANHWIIDVLAGAALAGAALTAAVRTQRAAGSPWSASGPTVHPRSRAAATMAGNVASVTRQDSGAEVQSESWSSTVPPPDRSRSTVRTTASGVVPDTQSRPQQDHSTG